MNIYSFWEKYAVELNQERDSYKHWENWKNDFLSWTGHLKELIVNEYFTEVNLLVSKQDFKKAILLCKVFNSCYFKESSEILFLELVISTKEILLEFREIAFNNLITSIYICCPKLQLISLLT